MLKKSLSSNGDIGAINTPLRRHGTPEEAANLIVFLLSDASSFITSVPCSLLMEDGTAGVNYSLRIYEVCVSHERTFSI
jgi:NAD(P)-dependent dehydrogenase (short-subunit alcohol dehydrogenase family)